LELVFHTPGQNAYDNPFEWNQFLLMIPYMMCTEEIAVAAITMMEEQYLMSGETIILRDLAEKVCHYPPPADYNGYNPDADAEAQPMWKKHKDNLGVVTCDFNFVELRGSLWDVANQAHKFAGRTKHSVANINLMLWRLEKRKIKAKRFTGYGVQEDRTSDMPILERSQQTKDKRIFLNVHYLTELLAKGMNNVFLDAVKGICSDVTRARKIITGKSFLDYHHRDGNVYTVPDVLQVVELVPSPNRAKVLQRKTDKHEPDITMSGDPEFFVLSQFLQREGVVTYEELNADSAYVPANYERAYTTAWDGVAPDTYPRSRLDDIFHEKATVLSSTKRRLEVDWGRNVKNRK
jgi:hypothetical protein